MVALAVTQAHTDALDNNDAAAVAANFTEDAVNVEQDGPTFGRKAIEKLWADRFQKVHSATTSSRSMGIPPTL
jgi:ketosteroid isomerase-like protein